MKRFAVIALLFASLAARAQDWNTLGALCMAESKSSAAYIPTASTNLIAWWKFNSGDGSSQVDAINGYVLTQATVAAMGSISNKAIYFNGNNQFLQTGSTNFLNGYTEVTVTLWAMENTPSSYAGLFVFNGASETDGMLFNSTDGLRVTICNNPGALSPAPRGTNFNMYSFTYLTGAGNGVKCYTNQTLFFSFPQSGAFSVNGPWRCGQYSSTLYPLNGAVSNLRVYNRALTTNEIQAVYNEGRTGGL